MLSATLGLVGLDDAFAEDSAPRLNGTEPSAVVGQREPLRLILRGSGFRPGTKVAMGRDGKVSVLQQDVVDFIDSSRLAITVMPGIKRSKWAIQVSTPDNQRSNVLYLEVAPSRRIPPAPAVSEPAQIIPPVGGPKTTLAEPAAKSASVSARATTDSAGIKDSAWLAEQPKSNYTLQLLASRSRINVEGFIRRYRLPSPLARFAMEKDGQTLHVLAYGSFTSRAAAQQAMQDLPAGVSAWPRSLGDVQGVMRPAEVSGVSISAPAVSSSDDKGTAWIWSQDPTRFTIQLAASSNEEAVLGVKQGLNLPEAELGVAQGRRNGKSWYVLVYGSFPDKESAVGTIERLPPTLKRSGPWPRSFSSLQDELSRSTP